jgi:hypothetical protein
MKWSLLFLAKKQNEMLIKLLCVFWHSYFFSVTFFFVISSNSKIEIQYHTKQQTCYNLAIHTKHSFFVLCCAVPLLLIILKFRFNLLYFFFPTFAQFLLLLLLQFTASQKKIVRQHNKRSDALCRKAFFDGARIIVSV